MGKCKTFDTHNFIFIPHIISLFSSVLFLRGVLYTTAHTTWCALMVAISAKRISTSQVVIHGRRYANVLAIVGNKLFVPSSMHLFFSFFFYLFIYFFLSFLFLSVIFSGQFSVSRTHIQLQHWSVYSWPMTLCFLPLSRTVHIIYLFIFIFFLSFFFVPAHSIV